MQLTWLGVEESDFPARNPSKTENRHSPSGSCASWNVGDGPCVVWMSGLVSDGSAGDVRSSAGCSYGLGSASFAETCS